MKEIENSMRCLLLLQEGENNSLRSDIKADVERIKANNKTNIDVHD